MANLNGSTRIAGYPIIHLGNIEYYTEGILGNIKTALNLNNNSISGVSTIVATGGIYGGASGATDAWIWRVSPTYNNYGIYYNEGTTDLIEYQWSGAVKAKLSLEDGSHYLALGSGAKVGINTVSPLYKLDIQASASNEKVFRLSHPTSPADAGFNIGFNTDGTTADNVVSMGVEYSAVEYDVINIKRSTRNVGIGITNPTMPLDVYGGLYVNGPNGNTDTIMKIKSNNGVAEIYADSSSALHFKGVNIAFDTTLVVNGGMLFQTFGQSLDFNGASISNISSLTVTGATSFVKVNPDWNGYPGEYAQGFVVEGTNMSSGNNNNWTYQAKVDGTRNFGVKSDGAIYTTNRLGIGANTLASVYALEIDTALNTVARITKTTANIDTDETVLTLKHKTSGDMVSGFGVQLSFSGEDSANVNQEFARIGAERTLTDDRGELVFYTRNFGIIEEMMRIDYGGDIYFKNGSAMTLKTKRATATGLDGYGMTFGVGGAASGATNKNGGDLSLTSGIATGTGSSSITFSTATAGATGTADRTPSLKWTIYGSGILESSGSQTIRSSTGHLILASNGGNGNVVLTPNGTGGVSITSGATTGNGLTIVANSLTSGLGLSLVSTSTAGLGSNNTKMLNIARSGANAISGHTAYGVYATVTNTGGTSANVAGYFSASGATVNYGLLVPAGNVGIGTSTPNTILNVSGGTVKVENSTNIPGIILEGATSGWASGIQFKNTTATTGRNYGIYANNTGILNISDETAGATRLAIDTAGKVGIGTTAPVAPLDIYYNGAINAPMLSIRADFTAVGKYAMIRFGDKTQTTDYQKGAIIYEGVAGSARGKFHIALNNTDDSASVLLTDARLTVQSDGKVGIGITSPSQALDVNGTVRATDFVKADGTTIGASGWTISGNDVYSSGSGNVGIGISSPNAKLDVRGTLKVENGNATVVVKNSTSTDGITGMAYISFQTSNNTEYGWIGDGSVGINGMSVVAGLGDLLLTASTSGKKVQLKDSTGTVLTVSGGNVGINQVTPTEKLEVAGNIKMQSWTMKQDATTNSLKFIFG